MSIINEYMKNNRSQKHGWLVRHLECNDGFTMSVQASEYNYCKPRRSDEDWYYAVEVGYPSDKPTSFIEYAEDPSQPTDTVYGYVPIELVEQEIALHGGLKGPQEA